MAAASPKSTSSRSNTSSTRVSGGRSTGTSRGGKPAPGTRPSAEIRRVADLLKQVSDPTRLQVLMLLNEKERNVSELCTDLGTQSQPAVSHHLALLRHGRLIEPRRAGKHNFYGLTDAGRELARVIGTVVQS